MQDGQSLFGRGLIMQSAYVSLHPVPIAERLAATVRFPTVPSDEQPFDRRALFRWADDGGRWVEEGDNTLYEVRV